MLCPHPVDAKERETTLHPVSSTGFSYALSSPILGSISWCSCLSLAAAAAAAAARRLFQCAVRAGCSGTDTGTPTTWHKRPTKPWLLTFDGPYTRQRLRTSSRGKLGYPVPAAQYFKCSVKSLFFRKPRRYSRGTACWHKKSSSVFQAHHHRGPAS